MTGLLVLAAAAALAFFTRSKVSAMPPASPWAPIHDAESFRQRVGSVLRKLGPQLAGMDPGIIYTLFHAETGGGLSARGLDTLNKTRNLSNRHKGRTWTGPVYYVSKADPDIRVYQSLEDSVLDFVQLMRDPLYTKAFQAARMGAAWDYFYEIQHLSRGLSYSAQQGYENVLLARYAQVGKEVLV